LHSAQSTTTSEKPATPVKQPEPVQPKISPTKESESKPTPVAVKPESMEPRRFQSAKIPAQASQVFISVGLTPNEFYVQLVDEADQLAKLTDRLQAHCAAGSKVPKERIFLGMAYAAKFSSDGVFYRCVPTKIDGDSVKVRITFHLLK